jgi:hypothetical protein
MSFSLALPVIVEAPKRPGRPNILVIVADNVGYADIGVHGGQAVPTPQIPEPVAPPGSARLWRPDEDVGGLFVASPGTAVRANQQSPLSATSLHMLHFLWEHLGQFGVDGHRESPFDLGWRPGGRFVVGHRDESL